MEILLVNKEVNSDIYSASISLGEEGNFTTLKYRDSNRADEALETPAFLSSYRSSTFNHPLLEESPAVIYEDRGEITYDNIDELSGVFAKVIVSFIHFAPALKRLHVHPSETYPKNKRRRGVDYAPSVKLGSCQTISLKQFEQLIDDFREDENFSYQNDFVFDEVICLDKLGKVLDADTLYEGDKALLTTLLDKEEPIAIRYISAGLGHGAFAIRDIHKGEKIGLYTGEFRIKPKISRFGLHVENDMLDVFIDATNVGNLTRFINHGEKEPPLTTDPFIAKEKDNGVLLANCLYHQHPFFGLSFISVKAERDIAKGEQLLACYGDSYWRNKEKFYLTPDYKVLNTAGKRNRGVERPSQRDYQVMINNGVTAAKQPLLWRPLVALGLSLLVVLAINHIG